MWSSVFDAIYTQGRSIAENICLINNVNSYTESKIIPGLLLFVDFEIAFDTIIEWALVGKTLHHFGFGFSFNLVYRDIQTCVINNGFSAGFFELSRGVSKAGVSSIALHFYLVRRSVSYNHP